MPNSIDISCKTLRVLHQKYIKYTPQKALVKNETMFLCNLTKATMIGCQTNSQKVYITTRVVKHLYDKRSAAQYDFIIQKLHQVIKFPDDVYLNKSGKRGKLGFCKKFDEIMLFASLEENTFNDNWKELYVVTVFETDTDYLKKCTLIWSWRGGNPSS